MTTTFSLHLLPAVLLALPLAGQAQATDISGQYPALSATQAAPIVRNNPARDGSQVFYLRPAPGISVRSDVRNGVQTISNGRAVEFRVTQGRAEVLIDHPSDNPEILVDLPSGQFSLVKDGVYTFNAATDTVRVLHGEAIAFTGPADDSKGVKIKEAQGLELAGNLQPKAYDVSRADLDADLVGRQRLEGEDGSYGSYGDEGFGEGFYGGGFGDGFYGGGPFIGGGFGYPYGYDFAPYGFGYPLGIGLGFGYRGGFGGFRGGGFRVGGFRGGFGGFRGGGFRR